MGKIFSKKVEQLARDQSDWGNGGKSYSDIMDELRGALDMPVPEREEGMAMEMSDDPFYEFLGEDGPCPTIDQIKKIARVLGTSTSYLREAAIKDGCSYPRRAVAAIARNNGSRFG